ncbi:soma ferritin-like [Lycorma delicatula]|uniref:soma ferritin-like n=1 Tax=Lycorma delicatula TaxID=130591 RepID=UPI003F515949
MNFGYDRMSRIQFSKAQSSLNELLQIKMRLYFFKSNTPPLSKRDSNYQNENPPNNSNKNLKPTSIKKGYKSIVRHNYHPSVDEAINKQINMELYAAYWYTSLEYYFNRDDMGLPGFVQFFKEAAAEELVHAKSFMTFQRKRGGRIRFYHLEPPPEAEWSAACAIAESIELEKQVTRSIEDIATLAAENNDHHLNDFLCGEFLIEQYQGIKDLADLLSRVKRAGPNCGLIIIDGELLKKYGNKKSEKC